MNYMDYTDDACMFMFTSGQNARMQALFATGGARASLLSSLGCSPPNGGGSTCGTVSGLSSSAITTTTATISWTALSGATSYNVQYKPSTSSTWTTTTSATTSVGLSGLSAGTSYDYEVQAVCASGSGTYSAPLSFVTTSVTTTCTDIYESNNTSSTAKAIAVNTNITALIGTSTDKDYYKFTNTSAAPNIKVTLSNLPADYDVKLLNASGSTLYTSQNTGTTAETIKYNIAPVGTYYIYVYGYGGAYSATSCYTLNASTGSVAWRDAAEETTANTKLSEISYNVYPNPNNGTFNLTISSDEPAKVSVKVTDMLGNMVFVQGIDNVQGIVTTEMNLGNISSGVYNVMISNGKTTETKRIVVQK